MILVGLTRRTGCARGYSRLTQSIDGAVNGSATSQASTSNRRTDQYFVDGLVNARCGVYYPPHVASLPAAKRVSHRITTGNGMGGTQW